MGFLPGGVGALAQGVTPTHYRQVTAPRVGKRPVAPGAVPERHRIGVTQKAPWISASLVNCCQASSSPACPFSKDRRAGPKAFSFTAWCFGPR